MILRRTLFCLTLIYGIATLPAHATSPLQTENVIFVMTDGLRWQEVFSGADTVMMTGEQKDQVKNLPWSKIKFWRETPEERREALLPFLWSVVAKEGQLYGNAQANSPAKITNGLNFSYPGYSEILCGYVDPGVNSNDPIPNPNVTVLEWLHGKPGFAGKIAAFGAWDRFAAIFNARRCGFPVNAGYDPMPVEGLGKDVVLLNKLKAEMTRYWGGEPFDPLTFHTAMVYLRANKPRVLYLSLGETDEWGHEGRYDFYLDAAHQFDDNLKTLWETVQGMPEYAGKTTLIVATDHGRGDTPNAWRDHGEDTAGSENVWFGFLGPDTPARGMVRNSPLVTQDQIAATLAAFLGEDYVADQPKAGSKIEEVFAGAGAQN